MINPNPSPTGTKRFGLLSFGTGEDIDIDGFFKGEDLVDKSIAQIIEENAELEAGEFAKMFDEMVKKLGEDDSTAYNLLANAADLDNDFIYNIVKGVFGDGVTGIVLHTDRTGKVKSFGISLDDLKFEIYDVHIRLDGAIKLQWNEGKDIVYDKDLDIPSGLFDYVREQCKTTGSYAYSEMISNEEDPQNRTMRENTYLWELKDDVLSLTVTQSTYYIYDAIEAPGQGRTEMGSKEVKKCTFPNAENSAEASTDCGNWLCYHFSGDGGVTNEYYRFTRTYDQSGKLLNEDAQLQNEYSYTYADADVYFDPASKQLSFHSHHTDVIDEERSQTEEDVDCEESYYIYHVCRTCGADISRERNWKSHDFKDVKVELAEGATTCDDGVILTRKCSKCGKTETETLQYHRTIEDTETYDLPTHGSFKDGKLVIRKYHCACGENNSISVDTNEEGCDFDYSNSQELSNGHTLVTFHCVYEGCTAYYTIESWEEVVDECTSKQYGLYKFYYSEGNQLGDKQGYEVVSSRTYHDKGESTDEYTEYTLEDDGYTGYRYEHNYQGCIHTGPYSEIRDYRYDKLGRQIYDYYERTGKDAYVRWTKWEYVSDNSCECNITKYYNGEEESETGYNHRYERQWIGQTCTLPKYTINQCTICREGHAEFYDYPLGHEFHDGVCVRCGLEAGQEASGTIVLEDLSDYWDNEIPYAVGVWNRKSVSEVAVVLELVYLGSDGMEEVVSYEGTYIRVDLPGMELFDRMPVDCYVLTVDRNEVRAAVDGSKQFVGLRMTFVPTGGDNTQVISITLTDPSYEPATWEAQASAAGVGYDAYCATDGKRYPLF